MTIVFLHALPLDERMWERQRETFSAFAVATPRLYGRGPTMDAWAASLLAELEGELVLVGASMGGYCALAMARREPGRVRGLVLAGSRADADSPERRAGRADTIALIGREGARGLWESMRPKLLRDDADRHLVDRLQALALDHSPAEFAEAVGAIRDRADSTEVLRSLGDRSFAVIGDSDSFVACDEVPAHEVVVLPECAHLPSLERPAEFDELVMTRVADWTT